jgi:hypothetical protein
MQVETSKYLYWGGRGDGPYPRVRGVPYSANDIREMHECGTVPTSQQLAEELKLPWEAVLEALRYCDWMTYGSRMRGNRR